MKDIYELLNNIDIDEIEEMEVNDIEKERIKKKVRKSIKVNKKKSIGKIAASIGGVIIISTLIAKPTIAQNIPVIGGLMSEVLDVNKEFENYTETIGITQVKNGVEVTLQNVAIDDNLLFMDLIIKDNNKPIDEYSDEAMLDISNTKINVNNKEVIGSAYGINKDSNTVEVLKFLELDGITNSNTVNVNIDINNLLSSNSNFNINFSIERSKQNELTINKNINKEINFKDMEVKIKNVKITPLTISIDSTQKVNEEENYIDYIILDENGQELNSILSSRTRMWTIDKKYKCKSILYSKENLKSINIIPYYYENGEIKELEDYKFTIDLE